MIYERSQEYPPDYSPKFFVAPFEYGDDVYFSALEEHIVTGFVFEYYGDFAPEGDEQARLRIYLNDGEIVGKGGFRGPKTMVYDSGPFEISPGYQIKILSGLNLRTPDSLTWTVEFAGVSHQPNDRAGLIFRDSSLAGTKVAGSFRDFWQFENGTWRTATQSGQTLDFIARISGNVAPPVVAPTLAIRAGKESVTLEWTGPARLQGASSPAGPFADVPGALSPHVFKTTSADLQFWRLVQ